MPPKGPKKARWETNHPLGQPGPLWASGKDFKFSAPGFLESPFGVGSADEQVDLEQKLGKWAEPTVQAFQIPWEKFDDLTKNEQEYLQQWQIFPPIHPKRTQNQKRIMIAIHIWKCMKFLLKMKFNIEKDGHWFTQEEAQNGLEQSQRELANDLQMRRDGAHYGREEKKARRGRAQPVVDEGDNDLGFDVRLPPEEKKERKKPEQKKEGKRRAQQREQLSAFEEALGNARPPLMLPERQGQKSPQWLTHMFDTIANSPFPDYLTKAVMQISFPQLDNIMKKAASVRDRKQAVKNFENFPAPDTAMQTVGLWFAAIAAFNGLNKADTDRMVAQETKQFQGYAGIEHKIYLDRVAEFNKEFLDIHYASPELQQTGWNFQDFWQSLIQYMRFEFEFAEEKENEDAEMQPEQPPPPPQQPPEFSRIGNPIGPPRQPPQFDFEEEGLPPQMREALERNRLPRLELKQPADYDYGVEVGKQSIREGKSLHPETKRKLTKPQFDEILEKQFLNKPIADASQAELKQARKQAFSALGITNRETKRLLGAGWSSRRRTKFPPGKPPTNTEFEEVLEEYLDKPLEQSSADEVKAAIQEAADELDMEDDDVARIMRYFFGQNRGGNVSLQDADILPTEAEFDAMSKRKKKVKFKNEEQFDDFDKEGENGGGLVDIAEWDRDQ